MDDVENVVQEALLDEVVGSSQTSEKMIPASKVNDIIRSVTARVSKNAVSKYQRENVIQSSPGFDAEQIAKIAAEAAQKTLEQERQKMFEMQQAQIGQTIANDFLTKIQAQKGDIEDFDKVFAEIDPRAVPEIVELSTKVDNTAHVIKELWENPKKIAEFRALVQMDREARRNGIHSNAADREMQKLSDSIKKNLSAKNIKMPTDPVKNPSTAPNSDSGIMSVSEARRYLLKR